MKEEYLRSKKEKIKAFRGKVGKPAWDWKEQKL